MLGNSSDNTWKYYGEKDPYFGVLTLDKYTKDNIEKNKEAFFQTGDDYISEVVKNIEVHLLRGFKPKVAVDFGCGVGRLTIPLAKYAEIVYGIDISDGMLNEARNNSIQKGNILYVLSDDNLSLIPDGLDLVHSYIVFQHMPVDRGMQICRKLIEKLNIGGVGVLHFTYAIPGERNKLKRIMRTAFKRFPILYNIKQILKGTSGPMMQMNEYNLNELAKLIQEAGGKEIFITLSDHEFYGATFYFRK